MRRKHLNILGCVCKFKANFVRVKNIRRIYPERLKIFMSGNKTEAFGGIKSLRCRRSALLVLVISGAERWRVGHVESEAGTVVSKGINVSKDRDEEFWHLW